MADVLTPAQRRKNMQHIKNRDTKIEVLLRKALWKKGYRYRKNYNKLPGKPDIVILKYKIAEKGSNSKFWISKISRNREHDDEINKRLLFEGWTVIRFWGMEIKKHTDECVKVIEEAMLQEIIDNNDFLV